VRAYIPGLSFIREFVNFAKKSEKEGSANYFGSVAALTETDFPAGDATTKRRLCGPPEAGKIDMRMQMSAAQLRAPCNTSGGDAVK